LHAIALNGPSVISATSSSPRGSPLSNAASTKELASYDSASTSALAAASLRSAFIVSLGICDLGTTRRCVPPPSEAPNTTSRPCQPSTSKTVLSARSSVRSSTRTCATIVDDADVLHRCGRIQALSSVRCFFGLALGAASGGRERFLKPGLAARKHASWNSSTLAWTASYVSAIPGAGAGAGSWAAPPLAPGVDRAAAAAGVPEGCAEGSGGPGDAVGGLGGCAIVFYAPQRSERVVPDGSKSRSAELCRHLEAG